MVGLKLDRDEDLILESSDIEGASFEEGFSFERLALTTKNIIYQLKVSNGLFAKPTYYIKKNPLCSIKRRDGKIMAEKLYDDDWGDCIRIQFYDRVEYLALDTELEKNFLQHIFSLTDGQPMVEEPPFTYQVEQTQELVENAQRQPKESKPSFMERIESAPPLNETLSPTNIKNGMRTIGEAGAGVMSLFANKISEATNNAKESVMERLDNQRYVSVPPISQPAQQGFLATSANVAFCSNCGTQLNPDAKFCHGCGSPVTAPQSGNSTSVMNEMLQIANTAPIQQGREQYAGSVLKCPNCGATMDSMDVVCPDCGYQISSRKVTSSVQQLNNQLMQLEASRKKSLGILIDPIDKKKLALIKSYPIPSTIEDIMEFILLAIANIDVKGSKNNLFNSYVKLAGSDNSRMAISDAWVSKMQQAYQKAKIMFPDEPVFKRIEEAYLSKMKELKIKVD